MLNKKSLRQFVPIIIAAFAILTSCKDETGTHGLDVLPSDDLFKGTDSTTYVIAKNINIPNLRSDDATYAILGSVNDDNAGGTNASFISQVNIGEYVDQFNRSNDTVHYYVDSLVLNLAYAKNWWFGNPNARHNVQVHRLTEPVYLSQNYYSDMQIEGLISPEAIGQRISSAWDALPDTVWDDDQYVHQWQFRLDDELANEIFNYPAEILTDREAFMEAFGGLFLQSELIDTDTRGSLVRFDLLAGKSNMKLYYSYDEIDTISNETDTTRHLSYTFPINIENERINRFEHNLTDFIDFDNPDADEFIVQGMAGSKVEIDFNDIEFTDENNESKNLIEHWETLLNTDQDAENIYALSSVDLYFKADTNKQQSDNSYYSPIPPSLVLYQMDEDGNLVQPEYFYNPNDDSDWSPQFSGGNYNPETAEYRFSLAGESFKMMVKKPELRGPYYLAPPDPVSFPWQIVLMNNQSGEKPTPSLRMKYVTINP